jgi:hypothetical protein
MPKSHANHCSKSPLGKHILENPTPLRHSESAHTLKKPSRPYEHQSARERKQTAQWKASWRGTWIALLEPDAEEKDLYLNPNPRRAHAAGISGLFFFEGAVLGVLISKFLAQFVLPGFLLQPIEGLLPLAGQWKWKTNTTEEAVAIGLALAVTFAMWFRFGFRHDAYLEGVAPAKTHMEVAIEYLIAITGLAAEGCLLRPVPLVACQLWLSALALLVFSAALRYRIAAKQLSQKEVGSPEALWYLHVFAILPEKTAFGFAWTGYILLLLAITLTSQSVSVAMLLIASLLPLQLAYHIVGQPLKCARRFVVRALGPSRRLITSGPPWIHTAARWSSAVLSPFVTVLAFVCVAAFSFEKDLRLAAYSAAIMGLTSVLAPLAIILAWRGPADLHIEDRAQRPTFFACNLVFVAAGILTLIVLFKSGVRAETTFSLATLSP